LKAVAFIVVLKILPAKLFISNYNNEIIDIF